VPYKGETGYGIGYGSSSVHLIAGDTNVLEVDFITNNWLETC